MSVAGAGRSEGGIAACLFDSPLGPLTLRASGAGVLSVSFGGEAQAANPSRQSLAHLQQLAGELAAYFAGTLASFTAPLDLRGTDFQLSVWRALLAVPIGRTCSYMDIARGIGNVAAVRAVGMANGANPVAIVVPCHRVIGASGKLVGYGGELWRKQWLLDHERKWAKEDTGLFAATVSAPAR
jgi:methylated-DNA-[protein]-cysteine S-methyltransferase